MTDRELLKLAAKAGGIKLEWNDKGESGYWEDWRGLPNWEPWNPLTDDGDALRLAGKLGFTVNIWNMARKTFAGDGESGIGWTEPHGANADAATRRAIVRAAAIRTRADHEVTK